MMLDTMKTYGPDSFAGRLASVLQGSSDTTFYVVAVYFGSVNIRNTRYAIGSMLLADLVGVITAILLSYAFFA
jgi:spore maturation protein SpmB